MSRLFVTQKELALISDLNKELMKDLVGQFLVYFPISEAKTRNHEIYNESPEKVFDNPIKIPAIVSNEEDPIETNIFGPDYRSKINAFVHYNDLVDNNINIAVGDFVKWGDVYYEISNLVRLRPVMGHEEEMEGFRLECVMARTGKFFAPLEGPTERVYTDDNAVQTTFEQTLGESTIDGEPTGDRRDLIDRGVLEKPVTGPKKIINVPSSKSKAKSDFYGEGE